MKRKLKYYLTLSLILISALVYADSPTKEFVRARAIPLTYNFSESEHTYLKYNGNNIELYVINNTVSNSIPLDFYFKRLRFVTDQGEFFNSTPSMSQLSMFYEANKIYVLSPVEMKNPVDGITPLYWFSNEDLFNNPSKQIKKETLLQDIGAEWTLTHIDGVMLPVDNNPNVSLPLKNTTRALPANISMYTRHNQDYYFTMSKVDSLDILSATSKIKPKEVKK